MAYYDALIAKWAQAPAGTEQEKLDWINSQMIPGAAIRMVVPAALIHIRLDLQEMEALTEAKRASLNNAMKPTDIDFTPGSKTRTLFLSTFPVGSKTRKQLQAWCDAYDKHPIPWPALPVDKGGGGLGRPVTHNDLVEAKLKA